METIDSHNILSSENQEIRSNNEHNEEHHLNKKLIEYQKFITDVKTNLSKCKYRRALDEIERKEELFYDVENSWKIQELKVIAILKILNKKIFKGESPKNLKLKSIESWLRKIDIIIDNWIFSLTVDNRDIENINKDKTDEEEKQNNQEETEAVLNLILEQFLFMAKHKKQENQIADCAAILAVGESIINSFQAFTLNPKFLNTSQQIYLFISSLLISDNDFLSAKAYQALTIKSAFKELFFRLDLEEGTPLNSAKKPTTHCFNKVFINIVLAFYQRGVAEENLGDMTNAIEAYKQAVWFSRKYIKYQYPEISQLLSDIESRAITFHAIIVNKLQEKNYEYMLEANNEKKAEQSKPANIIKQDLFSKNKENYLKEKEREIEEVLNSLNFQEFEFIEDENKSFKVKSILSTLTLLNNFSSEQFKDLLKNDIDVREINNIDEDTVEKIQKRLNQIKTEQLYQKRESEKKRENFKALLVNSQLMKESIMKMFCANNSASDVNKDNNNNNNISNNVHESNADGNSSSKRKDKGKGLEEECLIRERNLRGKTKSRTDLNQQSKNMLFNFSGIKENEKDKAIVAHSRHNSYGELLIKKKNENNKNGLANNFNKAENLSSTLAQTMNAALWKNNKSLMNNLDKNNMQVNPNYSPYTEKLGAEKDFIRDKGDLSKSPFSFGNINDVENLLNEKNNSVLKFIDRSVEKADSKDKNLINKKNESYKTQNSKNNKSLNPNNNKTINKKAINYFRTKSGGNNSTFNFLNAQKEKVPKYNHDQYVLSKAFQQKLTNLEDLTKRETEFQKKILKLKRFEKLPVEAGEINNNMNIIKSETEKNFDQLIARNKCFSPMSYNNKVKKKREKGIKDDVKFHNERLKNRLEVSLIKSLDTKVLKKWENFQKKTEKTEQKVLRDEFIRKSRETVLLSFDKNEVIRKINEAQMTKIDRDLDTIGKGEVILKRMLRPKSNFHIKQNLLKGQIKDFGSNIKINNFSQTRIGRNVDSFVKIVGKGTNTFDSRSDVVCMSKR